MQVAECFIGSVFHVSFKTIMILPNKANYNELTVTEEQKLRFLMTFDILLNVYHYVSQ
jgi:hypothetical protein